MDLGMARNRRAHTAQHLSNTLEREKKANKHHIIIIIMGFFSFRNILILLSFSVLFGFVGHMLVYAQQ